MSRNESTDTERLLDRLDDGDRLALNHLLELHRMYLRRLIDLRMEDELRARVDPSDVVQEAQLIVSDRIDRFLQTRPVTFRVWLRSLALERLVDLRRRHLAEKRSVRREFRISNASSLVLAQHLLDGRPSQVVRRQELADKVRQTIMKLGPLDREILLLRHIEELSNVEAAAVLSIEPGTARRRLGRASVRLAQLLTDEDVQFDD